MAQKTPHYTDLTDEDLMARVQMRDHGAFSELVARYTHMFYAAAYRQCSNQNDAEDIVQDAFLKLWNRPEIWDASRGAKFTTWFYRVVINQAIDFMRKKKPTAAGDALDYIEDDRMSQLDVMEQDEQQNILEMALQTLPERQRAALNLCFYEGVSNKDAAEILNVGVKAVESLLMRAKAGLREELMRRGLLIPEKGEVRYYGS